MDLNTVNKKLIPNFLVLMLRQFGMLAINFATINIILARYLPVEVIGVFDIANGVFFFFQFFSDIGFAASLIQKRQITDQDLKTTFTLQEILVLVIFLALWFLSPSLASSYHLDLSGVWLIRALGISLVLSSFKVIPSALLERQLRFGPIVWIQLFETLIFNSLLVGLVYQGMRVEAFSWAVLGQAVIGAILINVVSPWKIGFGFWKSSAKEVLNFGIPFQINSLLALLKDRLIPLVIFGMVGTAGASYITWSQNWAFLPLQVMNQMIQITFPAMARLQDDKAGLKHVIERSLFLTGLLMYPILLGMMAVMPTVVATVVTHKWGPAIPLFYLFCINTFWATLSTPFTNAFNAIGKIGITLKLMIMWTVLTWALTPVLTYFMGTLGTALASALIAFTSIIPVLIVKKMIQIDLLKSIGKPLISSVVMAAIVYGLLQILPQSAPNLVISIIVGGLIYGGLILVLARQDIFAQIKELRNVKD